MFFTALRRLGCVLAPATALTFAALATGPTVAQGEAATFAVTKTADTADGSCDSDCSLREAIIAANAAADQDTVTVPAGRYELTLPGWPDTAANGDLDIRGSVAIRGAGAPRTIVAGAFFNDEEEDVSVRDARVLETWTPRATSLAATISGLTMTGGSDGGLLNGARVGLRLSQVAIQGNGFSFAGDGYSGSGGGIYNRGSLRIDRSAITGNSGGSRDGGGGIANEGTLLLRNTTVSGNDAGTGGGILSGGTLTVRSSTIASNTGHDQTGGIAAWGATSFKNTIVARNWGGTRPTATKRSTPPVTTSRTGGAAASRGRATCELTRASAPSEITAGRRSLTSC